MRTQAILACATMFLAIGAGDGAASLQNSSNTPAQGLLPGLWSPFQREAGPPVDNDPIMLALKKAKVQRPNLMLTRYRVLELKALYSVDPLLKKWVDHVVRMADGMIDTEPAAYQWDTNYNYYTNNIELGRTSLLRVQALGVAFQIFGRPQYADRGKVEALALAKLQWGGDYDYLATAEATNAMSLALNWMHQRLSVAERATLVDGIQRALAVTRRMIDTRAWWVQRPYNCNSVMAGSLIVGALALADGDKEVAYESLKRAIPTIQLSIRNLGSDGGWPEGYTYWDYATKYMSYALSCMDTALGNDFGLDKLAGMQRAGDFKQVMGGPAFQAVNFSDATTDACPASQMLFLADKYDRPDWAFIERQSVAKRGPSPMHVVWYNAAGAKEDVATKAPSRLFDAGGVAVLRQSLLDAGAPAAALRAGDNYVVHCMPELGNFIYEWSGMRWAIDFGYSDGGFRKKTSSQNVLVFNGQDQHNRAVANFTAFRDDLPNIFTVADLSAANPGLAYSWKRGVSLNQGGYTVVQDDFSAVQGVQVDWLMHTYARVIPDRNEALLEQNGKRLRLVVLEPQRVRIRVEQIGDRARVATDKAAYEIKFSMVGTGQSQRVRVALLPDVRDLPNPYDLPSLPLERWAGIQPILE